MVTSFDRPLERHETRSSPPGGGVTAAPSLSPDAWALGFKASKVGHRVNGSELRLTCPMGGLGLSLAGANSLRQYPWPERYWPEGHPFHGPLLRARILHRLFNAGQEAATKPRTSLLR